jgi:hypothetical protein
MPKFNTGDKVIYTNEFGVCWGEKTVTGIAPLDHPLSKYGPHYFIAPSDSSWCPVSELSLVAVDYCK